MIKEIEKILIQDKDFWQKYFGLTFYDQLRQNITENIIIIQKTTAYFSQRGRS